MNKKVGLYFIMVICATLFSLILTTSGCAKEKEEVSSTSHLKPAPDFVLEDLTGKEIKLSDFKGKVIILNFWAIWCPHCRIEIVRFIQLYQKFKDQGLEILGVCIPKGKMERVKLFVEKANIKYPILKASPEIVRDYGGIRGVPTTFVINKRGEIYKEYVGARDKSVYEEDIKFLLSE